MKWLEGNVFRTHEGWRGLGVWGWVGGTDGEVSQILEG